MTHGQQHQKNEGSNGGSWLCSRIGIATLVAVSVLGFLIYTGHSAHLLGYLPYLLILACPLMHIFMHGGHGGHQHNEEEDTASLTPEERKKRMEEKKKHKHGGC